MTNNLEFIDVATRLKSAATRKEFLSACDLIQYVASAGDRDRLSGIVKRRLEEFKAK